jgi:hypothetical protein
MKTVATPPNPLLRSRAAKIAFISVMLLIALLVGVIAFPGVIPGGWLKGRLEPILGRAFNRTVRLDSARITSFFPLTIRVTSISIENTGAGGPNAGRVEAATFGISLLDLARKRPYFTRIDIEGGTLDVTPGEHPRSALPRPAEPPTGNSPVAAALQSAPPPNPPLVIEVLSISRATIRVADPKRPKDRPLVFSDLTGEGSVTDRRLTCRTVKTTVAEGSFTGDGEATFGREATTFTVRGTLADADFENLFARADGSFVTGRGQLKLDLRGAFSATSGEFEQMEGTGETEIRDGGFPKIRLATPSAALPKLPTLPEVPSSIAGIDTSPVTDILGDILPTETKPAPTTPPAVGTDKTVRFQGLTFKFRFESGKLNLSEIACRLDEEHRATADGTILYRENPARISFQGKIPAGYFIRQKTVSAPILGTLGTEALSNLLVSVTVEGTVAKPTVRVGNLPIPL